MADRLTIWLYGMPVAVVRLERRRMSLRYTPEAIASFPAGTPLLSLGLPVTNESFSNAAVRTFLDGLLPEGDARRAIAEDFHLRADDTFGLAQALGRDCAGALVIWPEQASPPPPPTTLTAEPLSDEQLTHLVANLRTAPLGVDSDVRISLAGVQEKLLLTRLPDGRWGRPVEGTPSTHILKPEIRGYTHTVENELFCMRLAKALALSVAEVDTTTEGGRKLIVVARYDRLVDSKSGAVERVHQEDICQATETPPAQKYEEDGGPSLRRIAWLLREVDPASLEDLLRATALNVAVGNGDAHAKNFSLLHDRSGRIRLAPLYDLMSTLLYGQDRLAMYVNKVQRTSRVTFEHLVEEATEWGIAREHAREVLGDFLARLPSAIERAADECGDTPRELVKLAAKRSRALKTEGAKPRTRVTSSRRSV